MPEQKIRVVIADDHPLVRQTWKWILESHDHIQVIRECGSGTEIIECAEDLLPDIILMDINMSPVNGFEATRKILKKCPQLRIIGISVNNQPGYARNMVQLGARGYMTKNSSREEMIRAINQVMDGKTYICAEVFQKMQSSR